MAEVMIVYLLPNGEEREERWPNVAAFRAWAMTRNQRLQYTVYLEDEDGEWVLQEKGRIAGTTIGSDW
jgi:hypothetical protein